MSREPKNPPTVKPSDFRDATLPEQRANRRRNRHTTSDALWSDASADKLRAAVNAVCAAGCAVQFGYTKDGGAYVVRIVGDGEPYNEWIRPAEDIDLYLTGLYEDFVK